MISSDADVLKTRIRSGGLISAPANLPYHIQSSLPHQVRKKSVSREAQYNPPLLPTTGWS